MTLDDVASHETSPKSRQPAEPNWQHPTTVQAMFLDDVAAAGTDGLKGHYITSSVLRHMRNHGWIHIPDTWRADRVTLTEDGEAQLAAFKAAPIRLEPTQATALSRIARTGVDGYRAQFPGSALTRRVCERHGLVSGGLDHHGNSVPFLITDIGREALRRYQARPTRQAKATPTQVDLLADIAGGHFGPRRRPARGYSTGTYDVCEQHGWIEFTSPDEDRRCYPTITDVGRQVLSRCRDLAGLAVTSRGRIPKVAVSELRQGMRVRLANRRTYHGLGPWWVVVDRLVEVERNGISPGGFEVRTSDGRRYAGSLFHRAAKFEVKKPQ